jgi:hypothetical protein
VYDEMNEIGKELRAVEELITFCRKRKDCIGFEE